MNDKKHGVLVVLGLDADKKTHAARFAGAETEIAAKAAGLMGFKLGRAESGVAMAVAKDLPEGKVFATGKALVPYVKQEVYDKLLSLIVIEPSANGDKTKAATTGKAENPPGTVEKPTNGSAGKPDAIPPKSADPWAAIKVGSIVLALSPEKDDVGGYWKSVVVAASKDGNVLTLKWEGYPKLPKFTARRTEVGLLPSQGAPLG